MTAQAEARDQARSSRIDAIRTKLEADGHLTRDIDAVLKGQMVRNERVLTDKNVALASRRRLTTQGLGQAQAQT